MPSMVGRLQTAAHEQVSERARALALGLKSFIPDRDLPEALWETAYLLAESQVRTRPLLERLRILGLMATSLDQFFVEELTRWQTLASHHMTYARLLTHLADYVEPMVQQASTQLRTELLPTLAREYGVDISTPEQLPPAALDWLRIFFQERVYPLLTPLAIDPGHPFPFISSFSLNLIVSLRRSLQRDARQPLTYARIKVPRLLSRFIRVDVAGSERIYVRSEDIVRFFLPKLFPGLTVENTFLFRVVRAAEPSTGKEPFAQLGSRQQQLVLPVVRLDVEQEMPDHLLSWLIEHLQAPPYVCYQSSDQIGQLHLVELANLIEENG